MTRTKEIHAAKMRLRNLGRRLAELSRMQAPRAEITRRRFALTEEAYRDRVFLKYAENVKKQGVTA